MDESVRPPWETQESIADARLNRLETENELGGKLLKATIDLVSELQAQLDATKKALEQLIDYSDFDKDAAFEHLSGMSQVMEFFPDLYAYLSKEAEPTQELIDFLKLAHSAESGIAKEADRG